MSDYPARLTETNHVEPVPRRIRAMLDGQVIVDTTQARYVWEWPNYPQYYVPLADVADGVLVDEGAVQETRRGPAHIHGLKTGTSMRPGVAKVFREPAIDALNDTVRFEWAALDSWFEEDEEVFVHPRDPYSRVDTLRSTRHVRVELDGVVLADSHAPVLLFETGLPTRYYVPRTDLAMEHLRPSDTQTSCPYKGTTTAYWSAVIGDGVHDDIAWSYDFPVREVLPIAGLVAFYNERTDIYLDGELLERPKTHFG
jgi:uncharacterized protein (DUF427 family)